MPQQQNVTIAQNQRVIMHQWDVMRTTTTSSTSQTHERMRLSDFLRHSPHKFSGNTTLDQAD